MKKYPVFISMIVLFGANAVLAGNNVYTGNAEDNDFNNDTNWWNSIDSTDSAFFRGDKLDEYPSRAFPSLSEDATVSRVVFQGTLSDKSYTISGEKLTVDGNGDAKTTLIETQAVVSNNQTFANSIELVSINNANNLHIKTLGSGALVFSGTLSQGGASSGIGIGLGHGDIEVSGDISGSSKLWKIHSDGNGGKLKLTGSGVWSGNGTVQIANNAELLLMRDTSDSSGFSPGVLQLIGGSLKLGNNEQIADVVDLSLASASSLLALDGHTEAIRSLKFVNESSAGTIDMGNGGVLRLSNQDSSATWGTLTITDWENGVDHIYVDGGSFSASQLAAITFDGYPAGAKVEGGELLPNESSAGFSGWIGDYDLTGEEAGADADPDGDGIANLYEYGFGGDPTNPAVTGILPVFEFSGSTVEIVHVELTDSASGISYDVQQTPGLVSPAWTNAGILFVGESGEIGGFKSVTSQVFSADSVKFLKVFVEEL